MWLATADAGFGPRLGRPSGRSPFDASTRPSRLAAPSRRRAVGTAERRPRARLGSKTPSACRCSLSNSDRADRTRQFVRATGQFARTVFAELRSAGYRREDVLHFINEMMELISTDIRTSSTDEEPPGIFDAEAGLLDRTTITEVLDFELKRASRDRRRAPVSVLGLDLLVPSWVSSSVRARVHTLLAQEFHLRLRRSDAFGKLGAERYLVVLPEAKQGVAVALRDTLSQLMAERTDEFPDGMVLQLRWARDEARTASASTLLDECFAQPPDVVAHTSGAGRARQRTTSPGAESLERVILSLGGGAARAASHAGVLAALEESGIEVAGIAGSSGGAIVGAMRAKGMKPEEITGRFAEFSQTKIYRAMRRAYAAFLRDSRRAGKQIRDHALGESSLPFYSETKLSAVPQALLDEFVEYFVGTDCEIASLSIPLAVAATDLAEGGAVVLSHGSLHAALRASSAVPGLFPLQARAQGILADGAAVSEVPIGAAHVLGLSVPVLAVHLEHPQKRVDNYQSSAEVVSRMGTLVHRELVREQLRRARFLISVPVQAVGWLEFRRAEESAAIGKQAAQRALADGALICPP